jgi:hypothetical protein
VSPEPRDKEGHPKFGAIYRLTGRDGEPAISNGSSWGEAMLHCRLCGRAMTSSDDFSTLTCRTCSRVSE